MTDETEPGPKRDKATILAQINDAFAKKTVPHNGALGLRAIDFDEGVAVMVLPYAEKLIGNPATRVLHGGAITSLLDATSGMSVFMKLGKPTRIATIDLRIDYLRPAKPDRDVVARAECYKLTRHVAFARAIAHDGDEDDPVASAAGTFMIFEKGSSPVVERMKGGGS